MSGSEWRQWPEVRDLAVEVERIAQHRLGRALLAKLTRLAKGMGDYKPPAPVVEWERTSGEG